MTSSNTPNPLVPSLLAGTGDVGRKKSNLAFALRTLDSKRQADALVFYDFCRLVDDIADTPGIPKEIRCSALNAWKAALKGIPGAPPLPPDLLDVIEKHAIDRTHLVAVVEGVEQDIEPMDFQSFDDLYAYCWKVASAVGLASIRIFGVPASLGTDYAEHLGIALQLTNIIRDVGEDADNGRIYLPIEDLEKFGVSKDEVLKKCDSSNFQQLLKFQIQRASEYFALAEANYPMDCSTALRPARLMTQVYSRLLKKIDSGHRSVLHHRYRLSSFEKLFLLLQR